MANSGSQLLWDFPCTRSLAYDKVAAHSEQQQRWISRTRVFSLGVFSLDFAVVALASCYSAKCVFTCCTIARCSLATVIPLPLVPARAHMLCNVYYTLGFRTTRVFGNNVLSLEPFPSRRIRCHSSRKKREQIIILVFRFVCSDFLTLRSIFPIFFLSASFNSNFISFVLRHRNDFTRSIALANDADAVSKTTKY